MPATSESVPYPHQVRDAATMHNGSFRAFDQFKIPKSMQVQRHQLHGTTLRTFFHDRFMPPPTEHVVSGGGHGNNRYQLDVQRTQSSGVLHTDSVKAPVMTSAMAISQVSPSTSPGTSVRTSPRLPHAQVIQHANPSTGATVGRICGTTSSSAGTHQMGGPTTLKHTIHHLPGNDHEDTEREVMLGTYTAHTPTTLNERPEECNIPTTITGQSLDSSQPKASESSGNYHHYANQSALDILSSVASREHQKMVLGLRRPRSSSTVDSTEDQSSQAASQHDSQMAHNSLPHDLRMIRIPQPDQLNINKSQYVVETARSTHSSAVPAATIPTTVLTRGIWCPQTPSPRSLPSPVMQHQTLQPILMCPERFPYVATSVNTTSAMHFFSTRFPHTYPHGPSNVTDPSVQKDAPVRHLDKTTPGSIPPNGLTSNVRCPVHSKDTRTSPPQIRGTVMPDLSILTKPDGASGTPTARTNIQTQNVACKPGIIVAQRASPAARPISHSHVTSLTMGRTTTPPERRISAHSPEYGLSSSQSSPVVHRGVPTQAACITPPSQLPTAVLPAVAAQSHKTKGTHTSVTSAEQCSKDYNVSVQAMNMLVSHENQGQSLKRVPMTRPESVTAEHHSHPNVSTESVTSSSVLMALKSHNLTHIQGPLPFVPTTHSGVGIGQRQLSDSSTPSRHSSVSSWEASATPVNLSRAPSVSHEQLSQATENTVPRRTKKSTDIMCNICKFKCRYSREWKSHVRQLHWDKVDKFICKECIIPFKDKDDFLKHARLLHAKSFPQKLIPEKYLQPLVENLRGSTRDEGENVLQICANVAQNRATDNSVQSSKTSVNVAGMEHNIAPDTSASIASSHTQVVSQPEDTQKSLQTNQNPNNFVHSLQLSDVSTDSCSTNDKCSEVCMHSEVSQPESCRNEQSKVKTSTKNLCESSTMEHDVALPIATKVEDTSQNSTSQAPSHNVEENVAEVTCDNKTIIKEEPDDQCDPENDAASTISYVSTPNRLEEVGMFSYNDHKPAGDLSETCFKSDGNLCQLGNCQIVSDTSELSGNVLDQKPRQTQTKWSGNGHDETTMPSDVYSDTTAAQLLDETYSFIDLNDPPSPMYYEVGSSATKLNIRPRLVNLRKVKRTRVSKRRSKGAPKSTYLKYSTYFQKPKKNRQKKHFFSPLEDENCPTLPDLITDYSCLHKTSKKGSKKPSIYQKMSLQVANQTMHLNDHQVIGNIVPILNKSILSDESRQRENHLERRDTRDEIQSSVPPESAESSREVQKKHDQDASVRRLQNETKQESKELEESPSDHSLQTTNFEVKHGRMDGEVRPVTEDEPRLSEARAVSNTSIIDVACAANRSDSKENGTAIESNPSQTSNMPFSEPIWKSMDIEEALGDTDKVLRPADVSSDQVLHTELASAKLSNINKIHCRILDTPQTDSNSEPFSIGESVTVSCAPSNLSTTEEDSSFEHSSTTVARDDSGISSTPGRKKLRRCKVHLEKLRKGYHNTMLHKKQDESSSSEPVLSSQGTSAKTIDTVSTIQSVSNEEGPNISLNKYHSKDEHVPSANVELNPGDISSEDISGIPCLDSPENMPSSTSESKGCSSPIEEGQSEQNLLITSTVQLTSDKFSNLHNGTSIEQGHMLSDCIDNIIHQELARSEETKDQLETALADNIEVTGNVSHGAFDVKDKPTGVHEKTCNRENAGRNETIIANDTITKTDGVLEKAKNHLNANSCIPAVRRCTYDVVFDLSKHSFTQMSTSRTKLQSPYPRKDDTSKATSQQQRVDSTGCDSSLQAITGKKSDDVGVHSSISRKRLHQTDDFQTKASVDSTRVCKPRQKSKRKKGNSPPNAHLAEGASAFHVADSSCDDLMHEQSSDGTSIDAQTVQGHNTTCSPSNVDVVEAGSTKLDPYIRVPEDADSDSNAEESWGCLLCTFSSTQVEVIDHITCKHVAKKHYFCPKCSYSNLEYSNVEHHILGIHKDVTAVVLSKKCTRMKQLVEAMCISLPYETKWKNVKAKVEKVAKMSMFVKGKVDFNDLSKYVCHVCCKRIRTQILIRRHAALHWKDELRGNSQTSCKEVSCDDDILLELYDNKKIRTTARRAVESSLKQTHHLDDSIEVSTTQPTFLGCSEIADELWKTSGSQSKDLMIKLSKISTSPESTAAQPPAPGLFPSAAEIDQGTDELMQKTGVKAPKRKRKLNHKLVQRRNSASTEGSQRNDEAYTRPSSPALSTSSKSSCLTCSSTMTVPYHRTEDSQRPSVYQDSHRSFIASDIKLGMRPVVRLQNIDMVQLIPGNCNCAANNAPNFHSHDMTSQ